MGKRVGMIVGLEIWLDLAWTELENCLGLVICQGWAGDLVGLDI